MTDQNKKYVFITGATGFVGRALCQYLSAKNYGVRAVGREMLSVEDPLLEGVDIIVHLAGRVHHREDKGMQALPAYQQANVEGTRHWVEIAKERKIKRLIYISTIKVNGERTTSVPFYASDLPHPQDAYSLSKWQAEKVVQDTCHPVEWVIIRPPLVYGQGVKGNFKRLLQLAQLPLPLPFKSIKNSRSFVSIDNLCHFIEVCLEHPQARNEIFLVSDNNDLSTPDLIQLLWQQLDKRGKLFSFPVSLLKTSGLARLVDSLQVNIEKTRDLLAWDPPFSVAHAFRKWLDTPYKYL